MTYVIEMYWPKDNTWIRSASYPNVYTKEEAEDILQKDTWATYRMLPVEAQ